MSLLGPVSRRLAQGAALGAAVAGLGGGWALAAGGLALAAGGWALAAGGLARAGGPAVAAAGPRVATDRGCYLVGQPVTVRGSGFAPSRPFVVSLDDVYFGQDTSDAAGAFSATLRPGGLGAGIAQAVEHLEASDGTSTATTTFTLTRSAGARIIAPGGNVLTARAAIEAWGFAVAAPPRQVYLHYVAPTGAARRTVALGRTHGQCGVLQTGTRRIFPFTPASGTWTLQLDAHRAYAPHPGGPVARIRIGISGG